MATFVSYALRILFGYVSQRHALVKPLVLTGYRVSAFTKPMLALAHGYGGVAFFGALGALIMGQIWERRGFDAVARVSLAGLVLPSLYLATRCTRCEQQAG